MAEVVGSSVRKAFKSWIAKGASSSSASVKGIATSGDLIGGIELITPSMINGWAWHPSCDLYDIWLLSGKDLLSASRIDVHRADVEERVGCKGNHAFSLKLPTATNTLDLSDDLQVLALTADGSMRFPLFCMKGKSMTQLLLKAALDPRYNGMEGHFDGLTNGGVSLSGWCYNQFRPAERCTVYMQVEGVSPIPVQCDACRPGFAAMGYPENCGFSVSLGEVRHLGDFNGKSLTVTYDESGLLPLPQTAPIVIQSEAPISHTSLPDASSNPAKTANLDSIAELHSVVPQSRLLDLSAYWEELEEFKRLCDTFEMEILARAEQEAIKSSLEHKRASRWKRLFGG